MVTLSILTPTYNRVKTLERLYKSLLKQNNYDFEWIVIDDGSTDSTHIFMESIQKNPKFNIVYRQVENGGKCRALNYAIEYASSELSICVDSDDWLTVDSVQTIISRYKKFFLKEHKLIGMIAKRGYVQENRIKDLTIFKKSGNMTLYDFYHKWHGSGDTALIYLTDILKKNKFPEFLGEKFVSENTLYFQLDNLGKMLFIDKVIYLNEYQQDGLTANYKRLLEMNPNGTAYMYYIYYKSTKNIIMRIKYLGLANYYMRQTLSNCQIENIVKQKICKKIPNCLGGLISIIKKG